MLSEFSEPGEHPDWERSPTCALDVADQGRQEVTTIARHLRITRQRAGILVAEALEAFVNAGGDLEGLELLALLEDARRQAAGGGDS